MSLFSTVVATVALLLALVVNPHLVARHLTSRADLILHMAISGATAVGLNVLIPVTLHYGGFSITAMTLSAAHYALFAALAAAMALRRLSLLPTECAKARVLGLAAAAFALLVIPFTHLAGYDTYKWQDLATNVRVTEAIPWLVHPIALLGFVPRSYPSAQPLLLTTVQMLGGVGVGCGFYLVSLVCGICGIFGAATLGRQLLGDDRGGTWLGFLYLCSPVFMIHNHWAGGRGLFVSLFPLFICSLLQIRRLSSAAGVVALAGLLAAAHKVGTVAAVTMPIVLVFAWLLPNLNRRWVVTLLLVPVAVAALLLAPRIAGPGPLKPLIGLAWTNGSRFGLLAPLALIGLVASKQWLGSASWRFMLLAGLCTYPLACASPMYGALVALPFVTFAGAVGIRWLEAQNTSGHRAATRTAAALTALLALVPLAYRIHHATPPAVYAAACFLEKYDPDGPYRVIGPDRARRQIQAYVSGCPRFDLRAGDAAALTVARPPKTIPTGRRSLQKWIAYGRYLFQVGDVDVAWYGANPRSYYVVVNGQGTPPPGTRLLFRQNGVALYAPAGQHVPPRSSGNEEP